MSDNVECTAGYAYPERPTGFFFDGAHWKVTRVLAEWRTPQGKHFRVETAEGHLVDLIYGETNDEWVIEPR